MAGSVAKLTTDLKYYSATSPQVWPNSILLYKKTRRYQRQAFNNPLFIKSHCLLSKGGCCLRSHLGSKYDNKNTQNDREDANEAHRIRKTRREQ